MNWDCHLYPGEVQHLESLAAQGDALAAIYLYRYHAEYMGDRTAAEQWLQEATIEAHLRFAQQTAQG